MSLDDFVRRHEAIEQGIHIFPVCGFLNVTVPEPRRTRIPGITADPETETGPAPSRSTPDPSSAAHMASHRDVLKPPDLVDEENEP
jgi:hypothetical protein